MFRRPLLSLLLAGSAWGLAASPGLAADHEAPVRAAVPAETWVEHVVQPGENPWQLVLRKLRGPQFVLPLLSANGIVDPTRIRPGTTLRMRSSWLKLQALRAEVSFVRGDVSWRPSPTQEYRPLSTGLRLGSGAWLKTPPDGLCTLVFGAGTRSVVRPDSEVQLIESSTTALGTRGPMQLRIQVVRGGIESEVDPQRPGGRFEVLTPSGVATVRGTAFRVEADAQQTRASVDHGTVQVGNASGVRQVPRGFGSAVEKGRAPQPPHALLAAPELAGLPEEFSRFPAPWPLPAEPRAHGLQVEWLLQGDPQAVVAEPAAASGGLQGEGVPDGEHVLRVRHVDAEHFAGLAAERAVRVLRRPDPPVYQSPAPGSSLGEERPQLAWGRGEPPEVHLQLAAQADFGRVLVDQRLPNRGEIRLAEALDSGRWYWRLSAIDARGVEGPWGEVQTFDRLPAAPEGAAALSAKGSGRDRQSVLRWSKVPGASGYAVSLRPRVAGHEGQEGEERLFEADESATLALPGDLASGDYALRVRSLRPDGLNSAWSAPQQVKVPSLWNPWILAPFLVFLVW